MFVLLLIHVTSIQSYYKVLAYVQPLLCYEETQKCAFVSIGCQDT
jgi:hypothetical protein